MDIHTARQQLKTRSIYDLPLRVTFYARVSSESDEQLNSLGNQVQYYGDLIRRNHAWTYVDGYIDEGLSAATTKKRENFHRMIDDGKVGLFDLIITKEITRFARNTLDSIQYTRDLLNAGVAVFFQNDNINTLDEDSELRLTIMSGIAQDELRKLSSRVKFGHQQAIKNSVVLGNSRIFGYRKDGGRLVIDEDEAPMVRELFALYATGEYSMKQIETLFWERGYRNHNGNRIAHTTMSGMISNPKYKGYYVGNKVKVMDIFTKKQKFLPPEEWVMFKDETGEIVPAIVSEELWEQANAVLKKRSEDVKNRQGICNHANLFTGKLYCTHCGAAYYRKDSVDRRGNKSSKWVCSGKIKNGADSCPSFAIYESELKPLLFELFTDSDADADALIDEYVALYQSLDRSDDLAKRIAALEQQVETAEKKKQKLLTYNAMGELSDRDFLTMNRQCAQEIEDAQRELYDLTQQRDSAADFQKHIAAIRRVLQDAKKDATSGVINKEFVEQYIDKIYVTPEDDGSMRLQIKIFTGESTDKYLLNLRANAAKAVFSPQNLEGSTGHTFKKMIESYEKGL
ncbi:MAG: recombinase family protein [Oscillospiraceae bacterium]|nr:recombinase family protein [Oscillospiraceae bacterium]